MLLVWLPEFTRGMELPAVVLIAFAVDAIIGDPPWLYNRMAHPVAWVGKLAGAMERRFNAPSLSVAARFRRGLAMTVGLSVAGFVLAWLLTDLLRPLTGGWMIEALLASSLIAFRGLHDAVADVARLVETDEAAARQAVGRIVGRDTESLDEHGMARAAIESAAENFVDGVVAPLFWYLALGLPGLVLCKTANTLDSMVGYRTRRLADFGRPSARFDDAINWLPARIGGALICLAALPWPGASAGRAFSTMWRHAGRHRSPNAGWPEAAMAGALGLALGGPRSDAGERVAEPWLGDGRAEAGRADVRAALSLYRLAGMVLAALLLMLVMG